MEQLEEKLKLEKEITDLRREAKIWGEKVTTIKGEYNGVAAAKDKSEKMLGEFRDELKKVVTDISHEKLDWTIKKDEEQRKIDEKFSEAENVLKRKQELNEQEQKLRDIEQATTDKLNEHRQLELKVQQEVALLEAEKRQFQESKKVLVLADRKLIKDRENIKDQLINLIKECQTKF